MSIDDRLFGYKHAKQKYAFGRSDWERHARRREYYNYLKYVLIETSFGPLILLSPSARIVVLVLIAAHVFFYSISQILLFIMWYTYHLVIKIFQNIFTKWKIIIFLLMFVFCVMYGI